ncbi:hypothetical protein KAK06_14345 [Ideonella sp. 4Y11]|uniref:DUF2946 domain-containing protein n=1 Tax=Ideonella aquatica TaxID=2824119 RepID=A0A941BGS3_9BURK|nr:hypothetical protein [Ideonella aquatica]MBQ0960131.1 hypothetical protein [Ideonella aquatica]
MSSRRALLRRRVWTVWSAALAWAVLPTLMALAGLAPTPGVAMALGEVCSVAGTAAPSDDPAPAQAHGASCLLCVLSVPMLGTPTEPRSVPFLVASVAPDRPSAKDVWAPQPPPRRACPQGPPAHA